METCMKGDCNGSRVYRLHCSERASLSMPHAGFPWFCRGLQQALQTLTLPMQADSISAAEQRGVGKLAVAPCGSGTGSTL
jgi:hypothetical protein